MRPVWRPWVARLIPVALTAFAFVLWRMHAAAWGLGTRSPVLSFDPAQYALAARELAEHGRLGTRFALPIELAAHAGPPWPLAVVQPGLVIAEALLFRLVPAAGALAVPARREWLALVVPVLCYAGLGVALWAAARAWLARAAATVPGGAREAVAVTVAVAALLDPEAQHLATSGFTELPFTLGVVLAFALLAGGGAARRPLGFGLLLGVTGLFRGTMLAMLPAFALAVAVPAPDGAPPHGRRGGWGALARVLAGWALPMLPWWIYKARAFGNPGYDLSALGVWDGAGGRTWFSLTHLPAWPPLPRGAAAAAPLWAKLRSALPPLLGTLLRGPRPLWIGALALGAWRSAGLARRTALVLLAQAAAGLLVAATGAGWQRYLFPARVPLEAGGLLAALALLERLPRAWMGETSRRVAAAVLVAFVLAYGAWQESIGLAEARRAAAERGLPSVPTLEAIAARLDAESGPGDVVMSNLGPTLAWYADRAVVHLALTPANVEACRDRVDFRRIVVAFHDGAHAWDGWSGVIDRPADAPLQTFWLVRRERHWTSADGFVVVWLDLGPRPAPGGGRAEGGKRP